MSLSQYLNIRSEDLDFSSLLRSPHFPFPWTEGPECSHMNLKQKLRGYLTAVGLLFSFVYDRTRSQMLRTDEKRAISLSRGPTVEKVAFVFDELIYCFTAAPIPLGLHISHPALFPARYLPGSCLLLRIKLYILRAQNPVSISFPFQGFSSVNLWTR